ncbi:MAG: DUF1499 domain-containing protein [Planctomycetales bacterium]|nr:DUF1499 domain-containing protein [Planctomycetales bacterium]
MKKRLVYATVLVVVIAPLALQLVARMPPIPENLGVRNGQLAACPASPNCVSTRATDEQHAIEPVVFSGSTADAMARIQEALAALPRVRIVTADGAYLHAEATSRLFRFVDDVEFLYDEQNGVIHFRSASRVGHSDLGANRKRMEQFRKAWQRGADLPLGN